MGIFAAPHKDSTHARLHPVDHVVTAFLALTDATESMGGLVFSQGSHLKGQLQHQEDEVDEENLIGFSLAPECLGDATSEAGSVPLAAGQASLHSFRVVHWSGANASCHR